MSRGRLADSKRAARVQKRYGADSGGGTEDSRARGRDRARMNRLAYTHLGVGTSADAYSFYIWVRGNASNGRQTLVGQAIRLPETYCARIYRRRLPHFSRKASG